MKVTNRNQHPHFLYEIKWKKHWQPKIDKVVVPSRSLKTDKSPGNAITYGILDGQIKTHLLLLLSDYSTYFEIHRWKEVNKLAHLHS